MDNNFGFLLSEPTTSMRALGKPLFNVFYCYDVGIFGCWNESIQLDRPMPSASWRQPGETVNSCHNFSFNFAEVKSWNEKKAICLFVLSLPLLPVLLPTNYNSKKLFSFIRFLVAGLTCMHFQVIADFLFFGTAVLNSRTYWLTDYFPWHATFATWMYINCITNWLPE